MTSLNRLRLSLAALVTAMCALGSTAFALPNVGVHRTNGFRTTAEACKPAEAAIDLDINNVRARLMTGGDMWWNIGISEASYEVPRGTKKNSLFAGSVWVGGYDQQGQLKVAAQTYRQTGNDYWPGPLNRENATDKTQCNQWDRFWKLNKADVLAFRDLIKKGGDPTSDSRYDAILQWPATGNGDRAVGSDGSRLALLNGTTRGYAPFVDGDGDGLYHPTDPASGDYPDIFGDQYIWWAFNDRGNVKGETQTDAIGLEVQASAFAFGTKDALNDATFYRYRLINRSTQSLDSAYIATWTDADLGYAFDDYIGCDTVRGLGILYNGKSIDGSGQPNSYGSNIPMVGIDFFEGPLKYVVDPVSGKTDTFRLDMEGFYYFNNNNGAAGNPSNGQQVYGYMTGTTKQGQRFSYDWNGTSGSISKGYGTSDVRKYVFYGDPGVPSEWSECACQNTPDDRRFVHSSGPFKLESGSSPRAQNTITIGVVWTPDVGGCPNTSFRKIRSVDDLAQDLFDSGFKTLEGPEAPKMVIRELDRKLLFYLSNDALSNNFREKFGAVDSNNRDSIKYHASSAKTRRFADSLWKFEGYRVFQVRTSSVRPADIFDETGKVNTQLAAEVFECDIHNGVKTLRNWTRQDLGVGNDSTWTSVVKVDGTDQGIRHSFEINTDQFATGSDKRLVNYKSYYYVAVAYAYNDFGAKLDPVSGFRTVPSFNGSTRNSADTTQDLPYLESTHGQGGAPIPVDTAMPNPINGSLGDYLNAEYGDGVMVTRLEGTGNGGLAVQITKETEDAILASVDNSVSNPVYKAGQSPVNVQVIDPVAVPGGNWTLALKGDTIPVTVAQGKFEQHVANSAKWQLTYNGNGVNETIYSEATIGVLNEQILAKYGISVSVKQVVRPGFDQANGNGYISSSILYQDSSKAWLSGVHDEEERSFANWIRSGKKLTDASQTGQPAPRCDWTDYSLDTNQYYESMFATVAALKGSWAPYQLTAQNSSDSCGFAPAMKNTIATTNAQALGNIHSFDLVLTSDRSKWTRCPVIEMTESQAFAQDSAAKFKIRRHASFTGQVDDNGNPVYEKSVDSFGMSWFPGYAIDQESGMRVNIAFGEESFQVTNNGADMIWNPTSTDFDADDVERDNPIFGGKHYIYVLSTKYDKGEGLRAQLINPSTDARVRDSIRKFMSWVGMPLVSKGKQLLSLKDGLIPTETRLAVRVNRPYAKVGGGGQNNGMPLYTFSTDNVAKSTFSDGRSPLERDELLNNMKAVPNPYYGYGGAYEQSRLDTKVRITNLPRKVTIDIYSMDGSLIRRLTKDNELPYLDWDIRNAKSLPIASGMYLMHVNADGIGETVIKWFGAMRPIDVTNY